MVRAGGVWIMGDKIKFLFALSGLFCISMACGGGGGGDALVEDLAEKVLTEDQREYQVASIEKLKSFVPLSNEEWDEFTVRRVLNTFAYGGHSEDKQIQAWADKNPEVAISEMLTFYKEKDDDASPDIRIQKMTMAELGEYWSSNSPSNQTLNKKRKYYHLDNWNAPAKIWMELIGKRETNLFLHKYLLWETNDHMVANLETSVSNHQLAHYYDTLKHSLRLNGNYKNTIAEAAKSAAIASQYNHRKNKFKKGKFKGNEDFAREYHQLFFGILGENNPEHHELITIKNTALALTDMRVEHYQNDAGKWRMPIMVDFQTEYHYPAGLDILRRSINGVSAREKIDAIADIAMEHEESLNNLPVKIIEGLADDNLTEENKNTLRQAWKEDQTKNVLNFIRNYAISKTFHRQGRLKFLNSIERNVKIANKMAINNEESYLHRYSLESTLGREDIALFKPRHNVFGGQTGLEASDSASLFQEAYNRSVKSSYVYTHYDDKKVNWKRNWGKIAPRNEDGTFRVKEVAEWLWNRFIGDGLKNFAWHERAEVYALLASGYDFSRWYDEENPDRVFDTSELLSMKNFEFKNLEISRLNLDSNDDSKRRLANYHVGRAIAFITATPYMFVME